MATDIIEPPAPSPRNTSLRLVVVVGAVFFFLPFAAFVFGSRPRPIENRPLTELPSPGDGWSFFPDMTAWATDHLPLRDDAVDVNDSLVERAFGEPPLEGGSTGPVVGGSGSTAGLAGLFPRVIEGEDGWLYLGSDVRIPCLATRDIDEVVAEVDALRALVEESGRRFVFVVAPDKSTMVPEHLPHDYPGKDCSRERREEMWAALEGLPRWSEWLLDLRGPLLERQELDGEPIYRPNDTHWTLRGGAVYGQELLQRLQPGVTSYDEVVDRGVRERPGDLAALLGREIVDEYVEWDLERPGVEPDYGRLPPPSARPVRLQASTTGAALFTPRTLLMGDSFTAASRTLLFPLFADMTLLHSAAIEQPEVIAEQMAAADVVVVEVVERGMVSDGVSIASAEVRAAIAAALG